MDDRDRLARLYDENVDTVYSYARNRLGASEAELEAAPAVRLRGDCGDEPDFVESHHQFSDSQRVVQEAHAGLAPATPTSVRTHQAAADSADAVNVGARAAAHAADAALGALQ